jgi:hypothetical protein
MNEKDYIGKRGEIVFAFLIGKKCEGRFWFDCHYLGDKAETKDFMVYLIDPPRNEATFFVQVKATSKGYTGSGAQRKLKVCVTKKDVKKLKSVAGPAYVAGIDVEREHGFLCAITEKTGERLSGIPCTHRIDCALIVSLWKEVKEYWGSKKMLPADSLFS